MKAYLGLGSNIGDRFGALSEASRRLEECGITITGRSRVEETDPVDYLDQPVFVNCVLRVETDYSPEELLVCVKKIEREMGRLKTFEKGPRIIDIDILLYGDIVYRSETLVIPHAEIFCRDFVMRELLDVEPELTDPVSGQSYAEVLNVQEKKCC